jgi:hypothetical protein
MVDQVSRAGSDLRNGQFKVGRVMLRTKSDDDRFDRRILALDEQRQGPCEIAADIRP